jgi:hypothetical protein
MLFALRQLENQTFNQIDIQKVCTYMLRRMQQDEIDGVSAEQIRLSLAQSEVDEQKLKNDRKQSEIDLLTHGNVVASNYYNASQFITNNTINTFITTLPNSTTPQKSNPHANQHFNQHSSSSSSSSSTTTSSSSSTSSNSDSSSTTDWRHRLRVPLVQVIQHEVNSYKWFGAPSKHYFKSVVVPHVLQLLASIQTAQQQQQQQLLNHQEQEQRQQHVPPPLPLASQPSQQPSQPPLPLVSQPSQQPSQQPPHTTINITTTDSNANVNITTSGPNFTVHGSTNNGYITTTTITQGNNAATTTTTTTISTSTNTSTPSATNTTTPVLTSSLPSVLPSLASLDSSSDLKEELISYLTKLEKDLIASMYSSASGTFTF